MMGTASSSTQPAASEDEINVTNRSIPEQPPTRTETSQSTEPTSHFRNSSFSQMSFTQRNHTANAEANIPPEAAGWQMVEFDQHDSNSSNADSMQLFSTRKPRDFAAGLSSGLKSIAKGTLMGAASLVILPVAGARQEGFSGFLKGAAKGVATAAALPLAGVAVAGYQISRGVINTPTALYEKNSGKKWNYRKREWIDGSYYLEKEIEEVLKSPPPEYLTSTDDPSSTTGGENEAESPTRTQRAVVERDYYDLLEIPTNATPNEIRRQYYKLARRYHPDKNPNDPFAKTKFQDLGSAYQVLIDEKYREKYDKYGKSGTKDVPLLDCAMFFTMLFGSEKLEPFIGKLKMALYLDLMDKDTLSPSSTKLEFLQLQREVKLALALRDRIEAYITEDKEIQEIWEGEMERLADDLCQGSYGNVLVPAVGWVYENYATQFLGKLDTFLGMGGKYAKLRARSRHVGNAWSTAMSAARSTTAALQITRDERKAQKDSHKKVAVDDGEKNLDSSASDEGSQKKAAEAAIVQKMKHLEEALPVFVDMLLNVCVLDIEASVKSACKKVLKDMSVEISVRRSRANALIKMGNIFLLAGEKHKSTVIKENKDSARHKIEEAFIRAAQKKDDTS
ncbi:DnaJ domain-containing protein [Cardiosporidium cionae]|uniref:DnaJ domain-containing protein n=1 Tax=Cardiosporidium cionae TaxID=476202 RepID=A0ABQ7J7F1_9APIC|nr:DnaJ domain-containing protein [Cardiosporidium cionae]|eukprot:KAF8819917.1 DnaJ domain-containing protein [Cardiosporidium cionae]